MYRLLTACLALAAAVTLTGSAGADAGNGFKKFRSENGRFAVEMPGTPKKVSQDQDTDAGKITITGYMFATSDSGYGVFYFDLPMPAENVDAEKALSVLRPQDGNGLEVFSSKEITLGDGIPGREYTLIKDGVHMRLRMYVDGKRVYKVMVAGSTPGGLTADAAEQFLKSFKVTKAAE